jgi:D-lactate dehydrogenase
MDNYLSGDRALIDGKYAPTNLLRKEGLSMSKPIKVVLFDSKNFDRETFEHANQAFGFDLEFIENRLSEQTVSLARGADAVCPFIYDQVTAPLIDKLVQFHIKVVALRSAGYNNVDIKAALHKIRVMRVPAYSPYAIAEHAVSLILTLNRKTHRAYFRTRDGNFSIEGLMGFDLYGKTVGIIGTGKIGLVLIKILSGFGCKVLAHDKFPNETASKELGFDYVTLDTIYKTSDVISLNCPLTPETWHMINMQAIEMMKPGIILINTGRGHLIDTQALISGLKRHIIGAAGLDVYEEESDYFFADFSTQVMQDDTLARLLSFNNVLITSHQAFFTQEAVNAIAQTTLQNIADYFATGKASNEICYYCIENPLLCQHRKDSGCMKDQKSTA